MFLNLLSKNKFINKVNNILTIIGFKITWISCVFGEIYFNSFFGLVIGLLFLIFFFSYQSNKWKAFKLISLFSLIGYFFDMSLNYFGLYQINAKTTFFLLPIWLLVLWPSFSCLFIDVLFFLKNKKTLSFVLGSIFGPISYYAGVSLGLVIYTNFVSFVLISIFWGLMMMFYSNHFVAK